MTSEMTHPTDDELEAMAQYWGAQAQKAASQDAMLTAEKFGKTAAMLRACKSAPDHSDWNAAIEAAAKVADACKTQNQKIGASDYQKGLASAGQAIAHGIRILKKGTPND